MTTASTIDPATIREPATIVTRSLIMGPLSRARLSDGYRILYVPPGCTGVAPLSVDHSEEARYCMLLAMASRVSVP